MGRLGSGGWSGVEGVGVEVRGDVIGFEGFQVRGLGSGRSKDLGVWGRRSLGREVELKSTRSEGLGLEVGFGRFGLEELGSGLGKLGLGGAGGWGPESGVGLGRLGSGGAVGLGGLGLGELFGIRGVEVGGKLESKELE